VVLAGLIARQLGGGRFAQITTATAMLISGVYLAICSSFSMNSFDLLFWTLAAYIVVIIIKRNNPKLWLLFGVVAGLALQNKHTILFLGFGIVLGLLCTSQRKHLFSKWFWLAGLIVILIILPNLIWQIQHNFPSLEFYRYASLHKNYEYSLVEFLFNQMMNLSLINAPIVLLGLYYYFFNKDGKKYRFFGWAYIIILVTILIINGKGYYITPIYPIFLASGALMIEGILAKQGWRWLKPVIIVNLIIIGFIVAPFVIPILQPEIFIKSPYFMGFTPPKEQKQDAEILPSYFAGRFGWKKFVDTIAQVYHNLSPGEQKKCVIVTHHYAEAGSINLFGKKYNLPQAVADHNNYWLWGPGEKRGDVVISYRISAGLLEEIFEDVEEVGLMHCKYCKSSLKNKPIYLCRKPKMSIQKAWPRFKHYD